MRLPLGRLVAVSGVSGSGKSTLVRDILHNAYARRVKGAAQFDVGAHDRIEGLDGVADVLLVDQSPLGRSARSNPVTYTKAWDEIRQLFARSARAVSRGITARDFSFNSRRRPLRGVPGHGLADDRHAVPGRRDRALRRLRRRGASRRRVLAVRHARQEHRRRPRR